MKVHLRPEAEVDIEEAATWYAQQRDGLGDEFLDEVSRAFTLLANNPCMYPIIYRDTRRALIHRFPFGAHYRIEESTIVVVAVMHGSRHPKRWKDRT